MKPSRTLKLSGVIALTVVLAWPQLANAVGRWERSAAGQIKQDYYAPVNRGFLNLVNKYHLLPARKLHNRDTYGWLVKDIDYILRHLPNHPFGLRRATTMCVDNPDLLRCDKVDEYFKEGIEWSPNQPNTHALYGVFLQKTGKNEEAIKHYLTALRLNPALADAYYNLGLIYFEQENFESAAKYAKDAYANGHRSPSLRRKLQEKGLM